MKISFYNTIKRKKEFFSPISPGKIKLYTCGPTVYDYAHIGNFRAYLFEDILRRTLEYFDYEVLHIMNITDIDDKTIKSSIAQDKSLNEFTSYYSNAFLEDVDILNILPAHHYPKATDFIDEMIDMIKGLEEKGFTYKTDDNSVFFRISSFTNYGRLANLDPKSLQSGERVEDDEYEKEEGRDFALWKGYKDEDGDVHWDSPWGKGRPGWHIECSAMSMNYLGSHFDIHCGGVDNIFPHHENEIAQSSCFSGEKFVNYWLHNEHLIVDGKKMSKSLGNFYTIRDLLEKGFTPESIRFALISSHYRQKLNFTFERLENAQKSINKLRELLRRLEDNTDDSIEENKDYISKTENFIMEFDSCLSDDLNISGSLGALFTWTNWIFKMLDENSLSIKQCQKSIEKILIIDNILGIINIKGDIDDEIKKLILEREEARKDKDWQKSDKIRDLLLEKGIILEDTSSGTIWKFK